MECAAVFLFLVILLVLMMTWANRTHSGAERWGRAFQAVSFRYGGWFSKGGWFGRPTVRFRYSGTTVVVEAGVGGRPKRRYLQVRMNFPDPTLRCEVYPRRMEPRLPYLQLADAGTNFAAFDAEYVVFGDNRDETWRFLSEGVQLQLSRLRYMLGNDNIYLSVQAGQLFIKKEFPRHGGTEHIGEVVHIALELYDQALLTRSAAIQFLDHQTLAPTERCVCLVCGDELLDDVVLCRRCKTPHHRDCWMYFGSCSMYGCREPQFVVARITPPMAGPPRPKSPAS